MVLLLMRYRLLLHSLYEWSFLCVWSFFCNAEISVFSSCAIISLGIRDLAVFLLSRDCECFVFLPRSAEDWSVVYDTGICSYSLVLLSEITSL